MTAVRFSLMFSGCFVSLLIWAGCTAVVCLVDKKMEPASTVVYPSSQTMISNAPYGNYASFACETGSHKCVDICTVCYSHPTSTIECLAELLGLLCVKNFTDAMESLNSTNWCIWGNVNSLYSKLSNCTEEIFDCLLIPWPNPLVEQTFVDIHTKYFKDCPTEELSDPPPVIVFALVITPICLIPVMVCIVVLKTKNGDGSS